MKVTEEEEEKDVEDQNSKAASTGIKASDTITSRRQSFSSNFVVSGVLICPFACLMYSMLICTSIFLHLTRLLFGVHGWYYTFSQMTLAYTTRSHLLTPTYLLLITNQIDVDADLKLGAIMRSLFSNPSDREAGDKADDEDERLVSRYAEGTVRLI